MATSLKISNRFRIQLKVIIFQGLQNQTKKMETPRKVWTLLRLPQSTRIKIWSNLTPTPSEGTSESNLFFIIFVENISQPITSKISPPSTSSLEIYFLIFRLKININHLCKLRPRNFLNFISQERHIRIFVRMLIFFILTSSSNEN